MQQGFESVLLPEDKIMMTKLEAIVQPSRFEAVKEVLTELGISGMTITDVRGHGRQKGHTEVYRGREYTVDLLPKIKIELVIPDNMVDAAVDAILQSASTGKIGDGKIFISKVDQAIRIRNQERGVSASAETPKAVPTHRLGLGLATLPGLLLIALGVLLL